jgi:hypothetical protein
LSGLALVDMGLQLETASISATSIFPSALLYQNCLIPYRNPSQFAIEQELLRPNLGHFLLFILHVSPSIVRLTLLMAVVVSSSAPSF